MRLKVSSTTILGVGRWYVVLRRLTPNGMLAIGFGNTKSASRAMELLHTPYTTTE